jgi:hypothetical protein
MVRASKIREDGFMLVVRIPQLLFVFIKEIFMAVTTVSKARIKSALDSVFGPSKQYDSRKQRVLDKLFPVKKKAVKKKAA